MLLLMRIEKSPATVFTPLADGTAVLLNVDTRLYFNLNRTAAAIWQQIEKAQSVTLDELVRKTCEQFEVDEGAARQDLSDFARQLERLKMVSLA
ncbi:MAG TPA: PqqD family protein [Blastocatellia bacterium]|nr:PqqD family protein [Blastocatellia bacterium]